MVPHALRRLQPETRSVRLPGETPIGEQRAAIEAEMVPFARTVRPAAKGRKRT